MCELAGFLDKRAGSAARLLELPDERRLVLVHITKPLHVRYRRTGGGASDYVDAEMGALELHLCLCDVLFVQHLVRLHVAMLLASPLLKRLQAERVAREAKLAARLKSNQNKLAAPQLQTPTPAPPEAKSASRGARSVGFQLNAERVLLDWHDDPLPPACVATPLARLELSDIDLQLHNGPSSNQQLTSSCEQVPSRALSPAPTTYLQSLSAASDASETRETADVPSCSVSTDLRLSAVLRADMHNRFANASESLIAPWGAELSLAIDVECPRASSACAPGGNSTATALPSRHLMGRLSASEHLMLTLSPLAIDLIAALLAKLERVQSLPEAERSDPKRPLHAPARTQSPITAGVSRRQRDEPDLQRAAAVSSPSASASPLDARRVPLRSLSPSSALLRPSTHVAPRQLGLNALLLPTTLLPPNVPLPVKAPALSVDGPAEAAEELGPDAQVATPAVSLCASPEKSSTVAPPEPMADETMQFDEYARLHCTNLLVYCL